MKTTLLRICSLSVCGLLLAFGWAGDGASFKLKQPISMLPAASSRNAELQTRVSKVYGQLPLSFEANTGQFDRRAQFIARGAGYTLFLTGNEAVLSLQQATKIEDRGLKIKDRRLTAIRDPRSSTLRLQLLGANPAPRVSALAQTQSRSHYFIGNNPAQWRTNVSHFERIKYADVYPGVDVVWYGRQRQLEYDFIVKPGARAEQIKLSLAGARSLRPTDNGSVEVCLAAGKVRDAAGEVNEAEGVDEACVQLLKPVAWQEVEGERRAVECGYRLEAHNTIALQLGAYDARRELVIDPVLVYSTLLGGLGTEQGVAIAVDGEGSTYVTGNTNSTEFPGASSVQQSFGGQTDVFVAKLNPAGTALVWATWLGGNGSDFASELVLDAAGNVYVSGSTQSSNFPLKNALQSERKGTTDGFVAKLNPAGSMLLYATLLGGTGSEGIGGLAVDAEGNAYLTGSTTSFDFPTVNAWQADKRGEAFYASTNGGASWAAASGGLRVTSVFDIALDPANPATLYAATERGIFKTTNGGADWTQVGTAQLNLSVTQLVINPAAPQTLYALTGSAVFRSSDGGANWVRLTVSGPLRQLTLDPNTPNNLYAITFSNSLLKSTDGGVTWLPLLLPALGGSSFVRAFAVDPVNANVLYAGLQQGFWKSTNGGMNWTAVALNFPDSGSVGALSRLKISRSNPAVFYLLSSLGGLARSTDAGLTWQFPRLPVGVSPIAPAVIELDPTNAQVVYFGSEGLFKTTNGGESWTPLTNGLGSSVVRALAVPLNAPQTVYAGMNVTSDAFLSKLNPAGSALSFSTYLGGVGNDIAVDLALDASGIYLAGYTSAPDFPLANAYQDKLAGVTDAFVSKFNPAGTALLWSTFLGGTGTEFTYALALNGAGQVYVTGITFSRDFPTVRAVQPANASTMQGSAADAFVTRLSANGRQLDYSTYLGGNSDDWGQDLAVDAAGNAYLTGYTQSLDFPRVGDLAVNPPTGTFIWHAFVTKLNATGAAWDYSLTLGGDQQQAGQGIAVDATGQAYVTGWTSSENFPTTPGALRRTGPRDAFVAKIAVSADLALTLSDLPDPVQTNGTLSYTLLVTNNGPDVANNVSVTDTLPGGVTFISATNSQGSCSGTNTVTCNLGTLGNKARATITILVRANAVGTLTNRATVTSATPDVDASNNAVAQETRVVTLPSIFGRVTLADGSGLVGATVTLGGAQRPAATTASDGAYQFAELAVGGNHTVTPSLPGFVFNPPNRAFNNLTSDQRADFSAVQCAFTLAPLNQNVPATGGTNIVTLTATDPQCAWTARSNASWIRLNNANAGGLLSGNGNATLSFTVEPTVGARAGTLTIGGRVFTVFQQFYACGNLNLTAPPPTEILAPGPVTRVRTRDFNRDGLADLALINGDPVVGNERFTALTVLLAKREGGFAEPVRALNLTTNNSSDFRILDFQTGDLNGDGYLDLVAVGYLPNNAYRLWVILNNGAGGGFAAARATTLTSLHSAVAAGDYNGDNRAEVIVGSGSFERPLLLFANDGAGNLGAPQALASGGTSGQITVLEPADVDGNGKLDLFVVRLGTGVSVYKGDGAGALNFYSYEVHVFGGGGGNAVFGDFNGDQRPDIAVSGISELGLFINDGAGNFPAPKQIKPQVPYPVSALEVLAGDFNADGKTDLVLLPYSSFGAGVGFQLLHATSGGNFAPPLNYLMNSYQRSGGSALAVADVTRDGLPDLLFFNVVHNNTTSGVTTIAAQPGGGFAALRAYNFGPGSQTGTNALSAADVNGDGLIDLVAILFSSNKIGVLYGNGRGEFSEPVEVAAGVAASATVVRDFNRDARPDLAVLDSSNGTLAILLNNGRGGFTPGIQLNVGLNGFGLETADFNNDGNPDLLTRGQAGGLALFAGNGQGSFTRVTDGIGGTDLTGGVRPVIGDFNGDGNADLAFVRNSTSGSPSATVYSVLGNGQGGFAAPRSFMIEQNLNNLFAADLNQDGLTDLLYSASNFSTSGFQLAVRLNNGDGTFGAARNYQLGSGSNFLTVRDLNGDGRLDVIVPSERNLLVLLGKADGTLEEPLRFTAIDGPGLVVAEDFDNNGTIDLAVTRQGSTFGGILLNRSLCAPAGAVVAASAASFSLFNLAPESIVTLFGANLATSTQVANSLPLPTQLAGRSVRLRDSRGTEHIAPLFFVSPNQSNLQLPAGLAPGVALLSVLGGNEVVASGTLLIAPASPGLFTVNANGEGLAAAVVLRIKANGAQVFEPVARLDASNRFVPVPIDLSDEREQVFLLLYGTGIRGRSAVANVKASIGSVESTALFAGAVPGLIGLDQVNLLLPRSLAGSGEVNLLLTVDGSAANPVRISIR